MNAEGAGLVRRPVADGGAGADQGRLASLGLAFLDRAANRLGVLAVDGQLFSDALVIIDGKQAGKLTQTLIKPDGSLYIDGILTAKLPPGHADIPEENDYQGTIDSLEVKAGEHTILLQTEDGKTLEITASVPPGRHLVTYFSDEETLTWNNIKLKAAAGASVNVKP